MEILPGHKIKGKKCPKPIKQWAQCGVSYKVSECLKRNLFEKPTPIQAQGIPIIMSGRDMIGIAKTGSGKTLAFLLPMFRHVLDQPELEADDGPLAIIMTPTRELAMQIAREAKKFTKYLNINVVAIYGGNFFNLITLWSLIDNLIFFYNRNEHLGTDRRTEARHRDNRLHPRSHDRHVSSQQWPRHQSTPRHIRSPRRSRSHVRHGIRTAGQQDT